MQPQLSSLYPSHYTDQATAKTLISTQYTLLRKLQNDTVIYQAL